jgi:hypothetical protein
LPRAEQPRTEGRRQHFHLLLKEATEMVGFIEVDSRGGDAARFIERAIYTLRDEYAEAGIKIRTLVLESVPPVPQVVVGVITPVPDPYIGKLIDTIVEARAAAEKQLQNPQVNIFITHQEGGKRFRIPEEREQCEAYFASLSS